VRVHFQLGAVLERHGRLDDAEVAFREALDVEPDSAPVLNYLGYMNADRGVLLDEARKLLERAVAIDPENGAYLDSLGWVLYRLDEIDQAEVYLRKALERQGDSAVVLDHLADALNRKDALAEALNLWRRALEGEDEDDELNRTQVADKIRKAEAALGRRSEDEGR